MVPLWNHVRMFMFLGIFVLALFNNNDHNIFSAWCFGIRTYQHVSANVSFLN